MLRSFEQAALRDHPYNIYSIGYAPDPELLREVQKRIVYDSRYLGAWRDYIQMTKPLTIYMLLLTENDPGLWARIRPSLVKLSEDKRVDEIDPEARLRAMWVIQVGDDMITLEREKFEKVKQLFLHGELDKAIEELKHEHEQ